MKMFIIGLAVVLIVLFSSIPGTHAATPNDSELAVFNYTNELRSQYGLPPYRLSCILTDSARAKSEHMDQNGYFSHWTPSGLGPEYWKVLYG